MGIIKGPAIAFGSVNYIAILEPYKVTLDAFYSSLMIPSMISSTNISSSMFYSSMMSFLLRG